MQWERLENKKCREYHQSLMVLAFTTEMIGKK